MKILVVADHELESLWDYYRPGMLSDYKLILSCGDLKGEYLSFLTTMGNQRVFYVHGNHDGRYSAKPPEGCDSIEDKLIVYKGLRILGLGGSCCYNKGKHQYTEQQMESRARKLQKAIKIAGGVDIVLTHAAPRGIGDMEDIPHRGFEVFLELMERYHPQYLLHGHVHLSYGHNIRRVQTYKDTQVINCSGKYELDIEPRAELPRLTRIQRLYCSLFVKQLEIIK